MYCKYLDQDNHEYTHKYIRETAVSGGKRQENLFIDDNNMKHNNGKSN